MMRAQYYVLFFVAFFLLAPPASLAVPQLTSVYGKLTDVTGNPISGNYDFIFRIYSVESGGTALWTEYWNSTNGQVALNSGGYFSALLGSHTALNLPFDQQYWLSIQVANDLLSPRFKMGSVPYTYRANITENLAAGTKATGTLNMNNYDITSAGGIYGATLYEAGTALASKYLGISATAANSNQLGGQLPAYYLNTSTQFAGNVSGAYNNIQLASGSVGASQIAAGVIDAGKFVSDLNLGWANLTAYPGACGSGKAIQGLGDTLTCVDLNSTSGNVSGAGTQNYVAKFKTSGTIGNSAIYDDGTNVGIGTASPAGRFESSSTTAGQFAGVFTQTNFGEGTNIMLRNTGADISSGIGTAGESGVIKGNIAFYVNGKNNLTGLSEAMRVTSSGNVGIGTTSPSSKLEVAGTLNATSGGTMMLLDANGDLKIGV